MCELRVRMQSEGKQQEKGAGLAAWEAALAFGLVAGWSLAFTLALLWLSGWLRAAARPQAGRDRPRGGRLAEFQHAGWRQLALPDAAVRGLGVDAVEAPLAERLRKGARRLAMRRWSDAELSSRMPDRASSQVLRTRAREPECVGVRTYRHMDL